MSPFAEPNGSLPYHRLLALANASERVSREMSRLDRQSTVEHLARLFHDLLDAESAAVFLAADGTPPSLVLCAGYSDMKGFDIPSPPVPLKVQSVPGGGLTGHAAAAGRPIRLHGSELTGNRYVTGQPAAHLAGGVCRSTLIVPLPEAKGRPLVVLKLDNKKSNPGHFTAEDEVIVGLLAHVVVVVLEKHRDFQVNRTLAQEVREARTVAEVFAAFLRASAAGTRADRAEMFFWDEVAGGLRARLPPYGASLFAESRPPIGSPCWEAWNIGQEVLVADFALSPEWHPVGESSRSALVIPLKKEGFRRPGVLSLESQRPGNFDKHDAHHVTVLWEYAAIAVNMILEERSRAEPRPVHDRSGEFQVILQNVRDTFGFEAGVIYVPNYEEKKLVCLAHIGCEPTQPGQKEPTYEFNKPAFVTRVFADKEPLYSVDPRHDARVTQDGVRYYNIDGPMLGVPLVYRGQTLGVLIVWGRSRRPAPVLEDRQRLQPFASLAAAKIFLSGSERERTWALRHLQRVLASTQHELSSEEALRVVVKGVAEFGFDRVRAFSYDDHTQCFTPLDSWGMSDPGAFLRNCTIHAPSNPFAYHTVRTALREPWTRVYPRDADCPGPDPDYKRLEKPPNLSWAVIPLVIMGKLYGQLVVDFARAPREFTEDHLDYLTAAGSIAAGVIANSNAIRLLSAPGLPILYSRLNAHDPKPFVVLRLLVYLTCGEALGFSRALFFEYDRQTRRLAYFVGVGSLDKERFELIADNTRAMRLVEVLDRVGQFNDYVLNNALAGLSFAPTDPELAFLLREPEARHYALTHGTPRPAWVKALVERGFEAEHLLAAPLRLGDDLFGLFVVDRHWRREIGEADKAALRMFAQQAAHILKRHSLELEVGRAQRRSGWSKVAREVAHSMATPVTLLGGLINDLRSHLAADSPALGIAETMAHTLEKVETRRKRLQSLASAQKVEPRTTELRSILEGSLQATRGSGVKWDILFPTEHTERLLVLADQHRLGECFDQLVENSLYWLDTVQKPRKKITIKVRLPDLVSLPTGLDLSRRYALIEFMDNGPGVPRDQKEKIFEPEWSFRRENPTDHGLGLYVVWQIIDRHGGTISECGNPEPGDDQGATFHIHLPLPGDWPPPAEVATLGRTTWER